MDGWMGLGGAGRSLYDYDCMIDENEVCIRVHDYRVNLDPTISWQSAMLHRKPRGLSVKALDIITLRLYCTS